MKKVYYTNNTYILLPEKKKKKKNEEGSEFKSLKHFQFKKYLIHRTMCILRENNLSYEFIEIIRIYFFYHRTFFPSTYGILYILFIKQEK